jgi:uncharacterized protein YjdB
MRSLLLALALAACGSTPQGTLTLAPDSHMIIVGQSTFVTAYLNDGTDANTPVDATWSADPQGIVMLTTVSHIQKVTGLAVGQVVVTATAFDQNVKTGFTVVSP